jgi:hypothetical protein
MSGSKLSMTALLTTATGRETSTGRPDDVSVINGWSDIIAERSVCEPTASDRCLRYAAFATQHIEIRSRRFQIGESPGGVTNPGAEAAGDGLVRTCVRTFRVSRGHAVRRLGALSARYDTESANLRGANCRWQGGTLPLSYSRGSNASVTSNHRSPSQVDIDTYAWYRLVMRETVP